MWLFGLLAGLILLTCMKNLQLKGLARNERLDKLVLRHYLPKDFSPLTG